VRTRFAGRRASASWELPLAGVECVPPGRMPLELVYIAANRQASECCTLEMGAPTEEALNPCRLHTNDDSRNINHCPLPRLRNPGAKNYSIFFSSRAAPYHCAVFISAWAHRWRSPNCSLVTPPSCSWARRYPIARSFPFGTRSSRSILSAGWCRAE